MIEKVEVRTTLGMLLTLMLEDSSNGYVIEDIAGLDPVKATLVSTTMANMPGAVFQSARREPRNLLLKLKLEPNFVTTTVRQLRTRLYSFFAEGMEVSLRFHMADGLVVNIMGRVEKVDAPQFVQEPRVSISIMCYDPDFLELEELEVEGDTVDDLTEFTIDYEGGVRTGIQFVLNVDRTLTEFTIYHRPADNILRTFDFAAAMEDGDILTINSVTGNKYAELNRLGTVSSVLFGKSPQSNWIELQPGENTFRVFAEGDPIPFTITYLPRHGGL